MSKEAREALVLAEAEADKLGHRFILNEHLLLGLLESGDSYARELLTKKGLSAENLRPTVKALPQPADPMLRSTRLPAESQLVRRVGELLSQHKGQSPLQLLDDYIAEAGQDRKLRMRSLGHFAATTAAEVGDLNTARRYCNELLADKPDDPMALYTLADCLFRQGETVEARRRAEDCRRAAFSRGDRVGKVLAEMLEKRFPDFKVQP